MLIIRKASKVYAQMSKEEWVSFGEKHFKIAEQSEWWKNFLKGKEEKGEDKEEGKEDEKSEKAEEKEEKEASGATFDPKSGKFSLSKLAWAEMGRRAGFWG